MSTNRPRTDRMKSDRGTSDRGKSDRSDSPGLKAASKSSPVDPRLQAQRAERARRRRVGRIKRWLIASAAVLTVGAVGGAAWAVAWRTDLLAIKQVQVQGVDGKLRQAVQEAAMVPMGGPLVDLNAQDIQARVVALQWVRSALVRASWPNGVLIVVESRQGIGQDWSTGKAIDVDGTMFTIPGLAVSGLPQVRASDEGRLAALRTLERLPANLVKRITLVDAATRDDIRFTLESGAVVRWGSAEQVALKAEVLSALLARRALVYDVSSPLTPTTRGERRRDR